MKRQQSIENHPRQCLITTLALILSACLTFTDPAHARKERLELRLSQIELSGPPSAVVPADLNGDGIKDLVVVVAYTEWDQLEIEERTEMDDIQGLVEVLTIVPALLDRRELQVFLGDRGSGFHQSGSPLSIDHSVLSIAAGPPEHPILVLTDDGISTLRLTPSGEIRLEAVFEERPVLAQTESFIPDLPWIHDLDADGSVDILLPTSSGATVLLGGQPELRAVARLTYPFDQGEASANRALHYPLPEVRDVTGDGLPDLVMPHHRTRWKNYQVMVNLGRGQFADAKAPLGVYDPDAKQAKESTAPDSTAPDSTAPDSTAPDSTAPDSTAPVQRVVFFSDLDGDGRAEYVTEEDLSATGVGWRKELKEAKRPPFRYRLFQMDDNFSMSDQSYAQFDTLGYAFEGASDGEEVRIPGGLQDLDGDGRQDLVSLTLDFSLLQAVRVLTVRSINVGLDFHIWCQAPNGTFQAVEDLDLSGRFRLNLNNLKLGQLSQFAGDFDGDGRADFVQMGRGKKVSIHRGREGCFYGSEPDLLLQLEEEPRDLSLVKVEDFDGDGLTDLMVIQPQKNREDEATTPVRLDLYMSGAKEGGENHP